MEDMIYTSKRGKRIIFDDFCDESEEYGTFWVEMCPHCHNKYKGILGNRCDDRGSAQGTCSVEGCENEADYYVDFARDEVEVMDDANNTEPYNNQKEQRKEEVESVVPKKKKAPSFQKILNKINEAKTEEDAEKISDLLDELRICKAMDRKTLSFLEEQLDDKMYELAYPEN